MTSSLLIIILHDAIGGGAATAIEDQESSTLRQISHEGGKTIGNFLEFFWNRNVCVLSSKAASRRME